MTETELKKILTNHKKWLEVEGGERANLRWANLQEANLRWANLQEADLQGADLQGADLQRANLRWADLQGADLQGANLQGANLRWADLQGADLQGANLRWANLQRANLRWANLQEADLQGADLPPPPMLLLCNWGEVSGKLTTELMKYDASNHPDSTKFDEWSNGKGCPYDKGFQRSAFFHEKRSLWKPGKSKSARELVLMLFKEKEIKFSEDI